ncbi:MAG: hypothetical protein A2202_05015 [Bdellovibrionales bacterium RIFOXYA1_FULL_36_14]|nr:MAG: hypothetical protein A2202_05015 [Bdellovibrionales bacterium RIFOXYA1_FULL_36_14]
MEYIIRNAQLDDLEKIMPLLQVLYKNDVGSGLIKVIERCLRDRKYYKAIAFDNDNVIGFFLGSSRLEVDFESKCGIIEEIIVHNEYQGKGLGKALLDRFEIWAKENGCDDLLVPCGREGFYEKMGFEKYVIKRYWKSLK